MSWHNARVSYRFRQCNSLLRGGESSPPCWGRLPCTTPRAARCYSMAVRASTLGSLVFIPLVAEDSYRVAVHHAEDAGRKL